MFTKSGTLYADAYKYLRNKTINEVALQLKTSEENYTEENMTIPIDVSIKDGIIHFGTYFIAKPESMEYGNIKKAIIQLRYSNDDQIAIILNKDNSEETKLYYNKMQEWRDFATDVAKKAIELL